MKQTSPSSVLYRKNPVKRAGRFFINHIPDSIYLRWYYRQRTGRTLHLHPPVRFTEKLQWLKLHDHQPIYSQLADKYEVRRYVADTIGDQYLIPLIGVYDRFEEIDFDQLPNQFVLKCTHDSGGLVICKDKKSLDRPAAALKIGRCMANNYYYHAREWAYKKIRPRIVCEQYMVDESGTELKDYKIFCFHGEPKLIQVDLGRYAQHKRNFYSIDWELLPMQYVKPSGAEIVVPKPPHLDEMLDCARKLTCGFPFVRADFYSICGRVYFGELTFHPAAGMGIFTPDSLDEELGTLITLPKKSQK
ncbi:MAG: glycosyl transferase [Clostridiales bacterium]|nr:glycosyl transferase [Clostridiales bacterium]